MKTHNSAVKIGLLRGGERMREKVIQDTINYKQGNPIKSLYPEWEKVAILRNTYV